MDQVQFFLYGLLLASLLGLLIGWAFHHNLLNRNENYRKELEDLRAEHEEISEALADLQDRHEMISALFDATPAAIFVKNIRGQYMLLNDRLADIFNEKKEDILGKTDFEFLPPLVAKAVRDDDSLVVSSGKHYYIEETVPNTDGTPRLYSTSKFPLYNKMGKIYAVCGIATDITEMKMTKENLSLALSANGMGVYDWNLITGTHYWSEETKKLFQYEPAENFTLDKLDERIHPDDLEYVNQVFESCVATGNDFSMEYRVVQNDGSYKWLSFRSRPYLNKEGGLIRLLGVCWDITSAKNNELALREALNAHEQFMKLISHNVKTPLSSLKLRFQMARRNIEKGDPSIYTEDFVNKLIEATEVELERLSKTAEELAP